MELEADGDAVFLEEMGGQKRMVIIQRNGEMREMRGDRSGRSRDEWTQIAERCSYVVVHVARRARGAVCVYFCVV